MKFGATTDFPSSKEMNGENLRDDVLGPIFEGDCPIITDNSADNFFAAVEKRVNYLNTGSAPTIYESSIDLLHKLMPLRQEEFTFTEEFFNDWNKHNSPTKQKAMVKAVEDFSRFTDKEFSKKDVFTKCEVLLKQHDPEWAGRLVNNSSDIHNAISGPFLQAATKRLNTILDNRDVPDRYQLAYGGTTDKVAESINNTQYKYDFVAECDFSGNDMRQVRTAQACEGEWLYWLGAPKWVTDIMAKADTYKVYNRKFNFSATVSHQLPSGSTSTTFRNCVWNMSIFHRWVLDHGVTKFTAFFLGDDMIAFICEHRFGLGNKRLKNASRSYEFACKKAEMKGKVKTFDCSEAYRAEFLSKCFVYTGHGFRLIPKLGRAFAKFNVRANKNQRISNGEYMAGKALSYAYEFRYLPRVRDMLLTYVDDIGHDAVTIGVEAMGYNLASLVREVGRKAALTTIIVDDDDEITDDELTQFSSSRYGAGVWASDVYGLVEHLLYGEEDVPSTIYGKFAEVDYWN